VSHHAFLDDKLGCRVLVAAALVAVLAVSVPARADLPPANRSLNSAQLASNKLLEDAQNAIKAGNGRLALITLKNALTANPQNAAARVLLGKVLNLAGDSGGAERELRQARKDGAPPSQVLPPLFDVMLSRGEYEVLLTQFPDPGANAPEAATILIARAMAFQNLSRPADALDAINRALALRRNETSLISRARIALLQGKPAEARKFAEEAIPKAVTAEPMLFKAGLMLTASDFQGALDVSNQLLAKYPGNLRGRFARVEAYIGLNQDSKAKAEVEDIAAKVPRAEMATYYRALLLARARNSKAAWDVAQNLTADFRDSQPRIAYMVATMALNSGNDETAASILGRLLLKTPESPRARMMLASIRLKQNNADEALKVLEPLKDSSDFRVQELLSNAFVRLDRKSDALEALHKAEASGNAGADVKRSIAILDIQTGHTEQGIRALTQLNAQNPGDVSLATLLIPALVQAKRYSEAFAVADRLGSDPKQRALALTHRAGILLAQKNIAGAQATLDKAVAANPKQVEALAARAELLASMRKYAGARQDLQAIQALQPKNLDVLLNLANVAMLQGQDQDVHAFLRRAIAVAPQSPAPRLQLIRYMIARKDLKNALRAASEFARFAPSNGDAVGLLGDIQLAVGQKKQALATYRRLAALMPTSAAPQLRLSNALLATGDRLGASSALETAVNRAPTVPTVRAAQIRLMLSLGKNDAALASARAFQSANPGTDADILLSDTLDKAKQHDQAVAVLAKSLTDKPNNLVLMKLVRASQQAKDNGHAADLMSNWLATHPDDLVVRMEYANLLLEQGDNARAIPQYESALKQNPDNPIVLNNLGWLIQASNPKRAISLLDRAAELAPDSADIADTLGWARVQQKDAAGGLTLLNKAHGLAPKNGEITYHLVLALDANAKRDAARGLLKALLASGVQFKDKAAAEQLAANWR